MGFEPLARWLSFRWPTFGYLFVVHPRHSRNQRLIILEPHCNLAVACGRTADDADTTEWEMGFEPLARWLSFRWPTFGYLFVAHPRHSRNQRLIILEPHCNLAVACGRTADEQPESHSGERDDLFSKFHAYNSQAEVSSASAIDPRFVNRSRPQASRPVKRRKIVLLPRVRMM